MGIPEEQDSASRLRQRAEDILRGKPADLKDVPLEDIQKLVQDLQVHQIELTLQNEELRRVHLELETARDQLSDLYNFAPVGYCTLDKKGQILAGNRTLASLLGIDLARLLHSKLSDFISRDDQDALYLHIQRVFDTLQRQVDDIQIVHPSGERFVVRLESVIHQEDPSRMRMILSDITERKQAEKALAQYAQELERANQALRDFSFIVSHDLQEPLRKVKSFGESLKNNYGEALGKEGNDYISRMMSAAARMDSLLRGLLTYARVASKEMAFVEVNLREVAFEVLSDLEARLLQTRGKVEIDDLPKISADPLQMRQLFQNLISNGLKYHRPGVPPLVSINCRMIENKEVEIAVTDNGIGFEMQYAEHIFEPFARIEGKADADGSGMGLTICKKIIELHHGTITVSSVKDQGSTFTVTLPV